MNRCKFRKMKLSGVCWHCDKPADGVMDWPDGSETPECLECAILKGKCRIRGISANSHELKSKQAILGQNSLIEKATNGHQDCKEQAD